MEVKKIKTKLKINPEAIQPRYVSRIKNQYDAISFKDFNKKYMTEDVEECVKNGDLKGVSFRGFELTAHAKGWIYAFPTLGHMQLFKEGQMLVTKGDDFIISMDKKAFDKMYIEV